MGWAWNAGTSRREDDDDGGDPETGRDGGPAASTGQALTVLRDEHGGHWQDIRYQDGAWRATSRRHPQLRIAKATPGGLAAEMQQWSWTS